MSVHFKDKSAGHITKIAWGKKLTS